MKLTKGHNYSFISVGSKVSFTGYYGQNGSGGPSVYLDLNGVCMGFEIIPHVEQEPIKTFYI